MTNQNTPGLDAERVNLAEQLDTLRREHWTHWSAEENSIVGRASAALRSQLATTAQAEPVTYRCDICGGDVNFSAGGKPGVEFNMTGRVKPQPASSPVVGGDAEIQQLMKFYAVDSLQALIERQAYHIDQLQSRTKVGDGVPELALQRIREG